MNKFFINVNGLISDGENARISPLDRGFLYGDSVYEATRTFDRKPFRLNEHLDRLFQSAEKIYFYPKITKEEIKVEILRTIAASPFNNANIRLVLTRGTNEDLGLDPKLAMKENLIIYLKELSPNPKWWYEVGVSLKFYYKDSSSKGSLPKTGNYVENMLGHRSAVLENCFDSIMVNNDGSVTECTTSNIWIIKDNIIYTPSLSDGVLPGLTRSAILSLAKIYHLSNMEKSLSINDICEADECFLTSTTRFIVPVTVVEGRKIGVGIPGTRTLELMKLYADWIAKEISN